MAHDNKIRTNAKAKSMGLTKNMISKNRAVEIENSFELYRAAYETNTAHGYESWEFIFASQSDKQAIETGFKHEANGYRCIFVNRLILREDGQPSSIIIWGN